MNTTTTLNHLSAQMDSIVNHYGQAVCFDHADKVYSQMFRSEPVRICDMLNQQNLSMEDYYTEFHELADGLAREAIEQMFVKATGIECPIADESICDEDYDDYIGMEICAWSEKVTDWADCHNINVNRLIKETSQIIFLCNYKGEGEGAVLFTEQTRGLPIFVSKRESFNTIV